MFRVPSSGRALWVRTLLISVVLVGLLTTGLVGVASAPRSHASLSHPIATASIAPPARGAAPTTHVVAHTPSIHPSLTGTGTFWQNVSAGTVPFAQQGCATYAGFYTYNYCYPQAVQPSLLTLGNGDSGLGYSRVTNATASTCANASTYTIQRVGFQTSSNGGQSYGAAADIGNDTCSYLQSIEPSFGVGPSGTIYVTFVQYNISTREGSYTTRDTDALGFATSSDNGATFSNALTLNAAGNIARPQMAVFGQSIYIVFENISNGTSTINYGLYGYYYAYPISLDFIYSSDGGATWSLPQILPGQNSSTFWSALGAGIAVNATGTVAVSYFTNHSCPGWAPYYTCYDSGDDLVVITSTNNGTSWNGPVTVYAGVGESQYWPDGYYLNAYFQVVPASQIQFDASGQTLYVVWSGDYNKTALGATGVYSPYNNWHDAGIFAAVGSSAGTGWTTSMPNVPIDYQNYDDLANPALGVSGGTVYLTYLWANETYCSGGGCSALDGRYSQWLQTTTDGIHWTEPNFLAMANTCSYGSCNTGYASNSFPGFGSSVGFTSTGTPLVAYSLPQASVSTFQYWNGSYYSNTTDSTLLAVAQPWFGATVYVNFTEHNLLPGTPWSLSVNGKLFTTTDPFINITNMPMGGQVFIIGFPFQEAYGVQASPTLSVPGATTFGANATVDLNYSLTVLLNLGLEPTNPYDAYMNFNYNGTYYSMSIYTGCPTCTPSPNKYPGGDWYFPQGALITVMGGGFPLPPSYWTGTGSGSFNGSGTWANITMNGPVNETGWIGGFSNYDINVTASGVPATSVFHFGFDGNSYSGIASQPVNLTGVGTGAHKVSNVWANSSTPGWMYFGWPTTGNPVIVPLTISVPLDFAFEDVGAGTGTVTFQAQGFTPGTVWSLQFNHTTYSSDTPWINVTTYPGTYAISAFPAVSQNGSVGYAPSGVGPRISVVTGTTYTISYGQAYRVQATAGNGGSTTGSGAGWYSQGATTYFIASAHAGYAFGGWTGTGLGSYSGNSVRANVTVNGPIVEVASFYPLPSSRFNLTFTESGLAPGTWWTVFLGGTGYSSNQASFQVHNLLACGSPGGSYNLSIPYAYSSSGLARYLPTSHLAHTVCTTGTTVVNEVFAPQYYLTLQSTAGGFAEATIGFSTYASSLWVASGAVVQISALAQTGYEFLGWNGTGPGNVTAPGPNSGQTIVMAGPISELASFQLVVVPAPPTFNLDFRLGGLALAPGTSWGVTLSNSTWSGSYASTTADLLATGLPRGPYTLSVLSALSPNGLIKYASFGNPTTVTVSHNQTVPVSYSASYWVSISSTTGGTVTPASAFVQSGASILLKAVPSAGFEFVAWNCSAGSGCSGADQNLTVKVTASLVLVATFAPIHAPTSTTQVSSTSIWSQWTTWAGLAAVGLVVGLVVGLLVGRRRGRMPPGAEPHAAPDGAASEPVPPEEGATQ